MSNGKTAADKVMPAFASNPNVMCYIDGLYTYLKARADGALKSGAEAVKEKVAKSPATQRPRRPAWNDAQINRGRGGLRYEARPFCLRSMAVTHPVCANTQHVLSNSACFSGQVRCNSTSRASHLYDFARFHNHEHLNCVRALPSGPPMTAPIDPAFFALCQGCQILPVRGSAQADQAAGELAGRRRQGRAVRDGVWAVRGAAYRHVREVARATMVRHAYEGPGGRKTRLLCFSDDMDGMRKIPENVPDGAALEPYLHQAADGGAQPVLVATISVSAIITMQCCGRFLRTSGSTTSSPAQPSTTRPVEASTQCGCARPSATRTS